MQMQKVVRFLQYFWLVVAIVCFVMATYHLINSEIEPALFFYFFTAMATLLFFVRKRQLKRFDDMSK